MTGDSNSSVLSFVNGTVSSLTNRATTNDSSAAAFNPATRVESAANSIDLGSIAANTGDTVVYSAGGGAAVHGRSTAKSAFVIKTSDPNKVKLAAT